MYLLFWIKNHFEISKLIRKSWFYFRATWTKKMFQWILHSLEYKHPVLFYKKINTIKWDSWEHYYSLVKKLNSAMSAMLRTRAIFALKEKILATYLMAESSFIWLCRSRFIDLSHLIGVPSNIVSFESKLPSLLASKIQW